MEDPAALLYKQNAMRKHILKRIEDGVMTAFPSSASRLLKASARRIYKYTVFAGILMMAQK